MKKINYAITATLIIAFAVILFYTLLTSTTTTEAVLSVESKPSKNIVDKGQGEAFAIDVSFKNTGGTTGTWNVNVALEGEPYWNWHGTLRNLTLAKAETATLTWAGTVPSDAKVGSTTRLIVYFNDQFIPQNWWIHVPSTAELEITRSKIS